MKTWPKSVDQLPPMMDYNIRHGTHVHVLQRRAALSVRIRLELHDFRYANLKTSSARLASDGALKSAWT